MLHGTSDGLCFEDANELLVHVKVLIYRHTYIYTFTRTFNESMCVTKTNGCGTNQKYTNIHNVYSIKYCKNFTRLYCRSSLHVKYSSAQ